MEELKLRKVIAYEYVTLDGVMEAPEKWQFPYFSDDFAEFNKAQILSFGASLPGRVTYEIFASYWPLQTNNEIGLADKINSAPKFVLSSSLQKAEWNNSTLIKDGKNLSEEINKLKQQPGGDIGLSAVPHWSNRLCKLTSSMRFSSLSTLLLWEVESVFSKMERT